MIAQEDTERTMSGKAKKICLVTPEFPPANYGGLSRTAVRVADHLSTAGLEVHVLHATVVEGMPPLLDENDRVRRQGDLVIHEVGLGRECFHEKQRSLWECPHTLSLVMLSESLEILHRREDFDAFVSFFLYPVGYVTGLVARRFNRAHVSCVVGNDVKKYLFSPEKAFLCKSGLDNSDRVVFLCNDLMETAHAVTPVRKKARIILNSVHLPHETWRGPSADGTFTIGCAGIFKHAKGLPYLLKALAGLRLTGPATLELAGETRAEEVPLREFWLERLAVRDAVRLRGVVPHHGMPAWLAGLDAFVLPSVSEGCPNVLMEAMAVGVPCVASRVGATDILVGNGVSGLLVPYGDSDALAEALSGLRDDPELAVYLGQAARERMKLFSPERERGEWSAVLRELLDFP
jgi:glycosyltransferase involved in cell wall biosynthesis